jgi:hypothetical protein
MADVLRGNDKAHIERGYQVIARPSKIKPISFNDGPKPCLPLQGKPWVLWAQNISHTTPTYRGQRPLLGLEICAEEPPVLVRKL